MWNRSTAIFFLLSKGKAKKTKEITNKCWAELQKMWRVDRTVLAFLEKKSHFFLRSELEQVLALLKMSETGAWPSFFFFFRSELWNRC